MNREAGLRVPSDRERWGDKREDHWRIILANSVEDILGEDAVGDLVPEFENGREYTEIENIEWTREAMKRLDREVGEVDRRNILATCAHRVPDEYLEELRDPWKRTGDVDHLHDHWRRRFLSNLDKWFGDLPKEWLEFMVKNDWGEAGRKDGNVIIATKIPARPREFFESDDPRERRYHYCHCPRIKSVVLGDGEGISATYCYCGGGFYKSNWERVLGRSVDIELIKSVLKGDDVCQFRIVLPQDL